MAVEDKYQVKVTVKSVSDKCIFGHKVGDKIFFDGRTKGGHLLRGSLHDTARNRRDALWR